MQEDLRTVKDEEFRRVWEVMKETYENERHFNTLETQYRVLAYQWLFGAFAGIGLIMGSDPKLSFDKLWVVVGICIVSMIGIFQLWRMDIIIYQRLLHATFAVGLEMEAEYKFLPKIKTRMKDSVPGKSVTGVLFYFYYISIVFFSITGFAAVLYLEWEKIGSVPVILITLAVIALLVLIHWYMVIKSKENAQNE